MNNLRGLKRRQVGWAIGGLLLLVAGYNLWSYRGGYCTTASLMRLSHPAIFLMVLILVAVIVLQLVRGRKMRQQSMLQCQCGASLRTSWLYCPSCGTTRNIVPTQGR